MFVLYDLKYEKDYLISVIQVFILDSLANYNPVDDREAKSICERITPRLAHANAAVVLSAVKVTMQLLFYLL